MSVCESCNDHSLKVPGYDTAKTSGMETMIWTNTKRILVRLFTRRITAFLTMCRFANAMIVLFTIHTVAPTWAAFDEGAALTLSQQTG